ncbi:MAG: hypothetical protein ACT4PK_04275 [Gammaproteobacteria bacterium]
MNQPPGATLASVLHLRLADFGAKGVVEQARLRAQLEAVVAASLSAVPERDRIVLDAPDGVAVAVLGNPAGAFKVAQRCLEAAQVLPLCIGAHHGAVAVAGDGDDAAHGLVGDGLRSAGVASSFAKPSQILVTRAFREALAAHAPAREADLRSAGTFADDSVRTHELFIADREARKRRARRLLFSGLACIGLGILAGVGVRLYDAGILKLPGAAAPVAVAPVVTAPVAAAPAPAPKKAEAKPKPPPPPPPPAVIVFQVVPGGRVFIDGKARGDLPALKQLSLPAGRYELEIRYRKEDPLKRTLNLRAGQQVVIQHKFFEAPKSLKDLFK